MDKDYTKKPDLTDLCEIEKKLIDGLKMELSHGLYSNDICLDQLGKVTDMIKDIVETKKNCMKACYYETVIDAMKEAEDRTRCDYDEDDGVMGYDNRRYASGKYAPKGKGHYSPVFGFNPNMPLIEDNMIPLDYRNMMDGDIEMPKKDKMFRSSSRYGYSYDEYQDAKGKHDKPEMDSKARNHIGDMMTTTKEIWKDADPALRKSLKDDLTAFVTKELTV